MTAERGAAWPREGVRAGAVPALVGPGAPLTASDVARFSRHLLLPGLGFFMVR